MSGFVVVVLDGRYGRRFPSTTTTTDARNHILQKKNTHTRRVLARGNEDSGHVLSLAGGPLTLTATFPGPVTPSTKAEEVRCDTCSKGPPRPRRTRGGTCQPCKASKVRACSRLVGGCC